MATTIKTYPGIIQEFVVNDVDIVQTLPAVCNTGQVVVLTAQDGDNEPGIYRCEGNNMWVQSVGPAGAPGMNGADGKSVLNGTGVPESSLGVDGDFYIDTMNTTLYGPKVGGTWGDPVSLIGPNGRAGTDGKSVLNGTGVPSTALGVDGDFYIDTMNTTLYGPKVGGTWGDAVMLIGPRGEQGQTGAAGANGTGILNGDGPPADSVGVDGDFYIDVPNVSLYGPKVNGMWPDQGNSLIGPRGATGEEGAAAGFGTPTVHTLAAGQSATVTVDASSPNTEKVFHFGIPQGRDGVNGSNGMNGTNGTNGTDGKTILFGDNPPTPGDGTPGDFYVRTGPNPIWYGPKDNENTWPDGVSLVGPQGPAGQPNNDVPSPLVTDWVQRGTSGVYTNAKFPPNVEIAHVAGTNQFLVHGINQNSTLYNTFNEAVKAAGDWYASQIKNNSAGVTQNINSINDVNHDLRSLTDRVQTNENSISSLDTRVTNNSNDINAVERDVAVNAAAHKFNRSRSIVDANLHNRQERYNYCFEVVRVDSTRIYCETLNGYPGQLNTMGGGSSGTQNIGAAWLIPGGDSNSASVSTNFFRGRWNWIDPNGLYGFLSNLDGSAITESDQLPEPGTFIACWIY